MRPRHPRRAAAVVAAMSLLQPSAPLWSESPAQTATATKSAAPQTPAKPASPPAAQPAKATAAATTPPPIDGGWPRTYTLPSGGDIIVYQPQVSTWENQSRMVAFSAVSQRAKSATKPALGTIKLEADTKVSLTERLVNFQNMKIVEAKFETLPKEQVQELVATIDKTIPVSDRVIALDRVLANIDKSKIIPKQVEGIKADPPVIFFSKTPAVVVNLDGEPIWSPIKDNDLKFAVNTNWDLFQHTTTNTYYLRINENWLKATAVAGPWTPAGKLPDSFKKLPADENWKDVKANVPGKSIKAAAVPKVFVSNVPAELILLKGEPTYALVPQTTNLNWVSNTESDVFRTGKTGLVYYLVAGRWFSAPDFTGPWTFATLNLPESFKKIPLEHERSRVLASVPGTDQAAEAVLVAQIPQTARVNKKELKAPDIAYQGEPQFVGIETTSVQRAVNTDKDIFKVGDAYYLCYQGVWFTGKTANGPWEVASFIPQEIYKIPISSPANHVTYVTVEDNDDEWVTFAAAAGYTGMMIAWGCTVWGPGYYYPPYYGMGGFYPYYYPSFHTYGYSAWYNPRTGAYGRSAAVYGPYGGAGVSARYNPRTGTYSRGAAAYGPGGSRAVASAYNPRTGAYATTRQGSNVYGSWGSTAVQRGDDWAVTNRYTNRQTGTTTRTVRTDEGSAAIRRGDNGTVAVGDGGNIYAGNDGNVYRREDGTWQKYDNGNWSNTDRQPVRPDQGAGTGNRPTTGDGTRPSTDRPSTGATGGATASQRPSTMDSSTRSQLDRDSAARREGSQRTSDYGGYRSGSGSTTRSTGSYRGSGGASRGGGGGRRR